MDSQIIASLIAVIGTLGGAFVSAWVQRNSKKLTSLEITIDRYKAEIRARQAQEEVAAQWLSELGVATSAHAAKTLLRNRTEQQKGVRPAITPSEVREA